MNGHIHATNEKDKFNDMTLFQQIFSSNDDEVSRKSESFCATSEIKRGTVFKCGMLSIDVGSAADAGFLVVRDGKREETTVEWKAELHHRGLLPKWTFVVPRGGTWERSKQRYGSEVFSKAMRLKNMLQVEAQRTNAIWLGNDEH